MRAPGTCFSTARAAANMRFRTAGSVAVGTLYTLRFRAGNSTPPFSATTARTGQ
jgi:hypothetical protein